MYDAAYVLNDANVTVTVGVGGTVPGGVADGDPGDNSQFGSLIGYGGLGGERWINYGSTNGGASGAPQSMAGGGYNSGPEGGGGGGAGQVGQDCITGAGSKGGDGLQYAISGTPTYYGGGGAGGSGGYTLPDFLGGLGGGGNSHADGTGDSGGVNTGGGGAGGYAGGASGSGGKGIVIVSLLIS